MPDINAEIECNPETRSELLGIMNNKQTIRFPGIVEGEFFIVSVKTTVDQEKYPPRFHLDLVLRHTESHRDTRMTPK
jgi:hypothetical protein